MTAPIPQPAAAPPPPQPPLPPAADDPPPVVDGIDEAAHAPAPDPPDMPELPPSDGADPVRPGDLAAFAELLSRFQTRVDKAAAGRKHRPLRDAWVAAAQEIARHPDRVRLSEAAGLILHALRLGCESGKVVVVDACLDCIHRLFEYGHIGSPGDSTDIALDARPAALDDLVAMVCACLEVKDEDIYVRMVQTLLTAATRTRSGLHHGTLLAAVRTIYNIFLNARAAPTRTTARVSLTQILNLVFARMEAETAEDLTAIPASFAPAKAARHVDHDPDIHCTAAAAPAVDVPEPAPPAEEGGDPSSEFATVLQKDAYLLFRALCKLSAKDVPDALAVDNVGVRSKLLSLELLRNLINNSGPAFRSGDRFIYALRQYLSPSLLTNCMSNSPEVMDVAFDIFEMLLRKETLRPLLKTEIGALFGTVIFRFLESATAGPMRKRRAITLLNRVSGDRQTMADLFLNYDCDLDSPKIFERIVNVLSAAAQDKSYTTTEATVLASAPGTGQVDTRVLALTSVIQVVRSLRDWSKPIEAARVQEKPSLSSDYGEAGSDDAGTEHVGEANGDNAASPVSNQGDNEQDNEEDPVAPTKAMARPKSSGSGGLVLGTVSEGSDRDTARFEEAIKARRDMAEGMKLFNTKPKRGIEHLASAGRLKKEPSAVAEFLRKAENLDAAMVGEYLGEGDSFNVNVMHAYTDMNNFSDLTFDAALRLHLSGFRLPGEAQKIDRIMEKFASRYCECNPETFANADAAYVLAYSSIMLHTDAHNDTIKNKMSKEEFIRNNRGINDGGDLDPAFLGGLYDRITTTEIRLTGSMKDSTTGAAAKALDAATAAAAMDPAQRARKFKEESERLMAQTKVLFANKRRTAQDYTYYSATNVYHARLMFDSAWYPVLAAISLNLEEAPPTATNIVALCLDGFRNGIAVASTFGMSTTKDALVSSLAKFTHLNSISEMRPKNVECVRMILAIAALEGNNLGEQWIVIVRAISQLEQIRAVASGNPGKFLLQKAPLIGMGVSNGHGASEQDANNYSRTISGTSSVSGSENGFSGATTSSTQYGRTSSARPVSLSADGNSHTTESQSQKIDSKAALMASTIAESEIERIFTNSSQLSASGVADFCGALCTVALEELGEVPTPRLFCLQKIVEMAYYNMESRTRIQWGKIWLQMGPFFTSAMCHVNRDVAMYSVDALRQLASKFLDKDELSNFAFQKAFLKPFELCFGKSKSVPIRELVLTCVSQIVLARAANIKSGWKSVFAVLGLAADDRVESIMNFGWQIVDSIVRKYVGVLDDVYVDAVTGISAYTRTSVSTPVSLAAIGMLTDRCASCLAEGQALSVLREQVQARENLPESGLVRDGVWFSADEDYHIGAWFPILTGLASAMQDERPAVRIAANDGLYKVLTDHGGRFAPSLWALIFRGVLAPIFDDVRHLSASSDRSEAAAIGEWATTTGSASLKALVAVFVRHINVTRGLLGDLIALIRSWISQDTEIVAREGMGVMARLIMTGGHVLNSEDWNVVVRSISEIFVDTMPHEILGPDRQKCNDADVADSTTLESPSERKELLSDKEQQNGNGDSIAHAGEDNINEDDEGPDEKSGTRDGAIEDARNDDASAKRKIDFRVVRAKCVVQLLLIQLVQEIVVSFYTVLPTESILDLSESLDKSYSFAHDFNADIELRYSLWRAGFMNQVPNLLKQETTGLMAYLRIVFWLYLDPARTGSAEDKVLELCEKVMRGYTRSCMEAQSKSEERREVVALSPVICFIVNGIMQMSDSQFETHLPNLYAILLDMLEEADDTEVRHTIATLFRLRIRPELVSAGQVRKQHTGRGGRSTVTVAEPQLPGTMRECIVHAVLSEKGGQMPAEICAALNKIGGVRSVTSSIEGENAFCVASAAPDEMLVAGVVSLPFVRSAYVSPAPDAALD